MGRGGRVHQLPKDVVGGGKAEEHVTIAAPIGDVWRMFLDIERWHEYSKIYDFARWVTGTPWALGATFHARMNWPVQITVTHVVMAVDQEREIRWLVHAIGIVIERWIRFVDRGDETEIISSAIYFGVSTQQIPGEVSELLPQFTERYFSDFKAACEREYLAAQGHKSA
jgi:hypothetical protein